MFVTVRVIKKINPALIIAIILFLIPFFWFKPGAIDIGGDGTRLYFYDPIAFLQNVSLYSVAPEGKATIDPTKHAYLLYVGLIALLKNVVNSTHILINVFNGIKFSVGFLSIYYIVRELIQSSKLKNKRIISLETAAILAGFFYILATGSEKLIFFWIKALHSHDQVFLNPLIFFLVMRYLLTRNNWYLISILFITFIFSTNFAMISSPAFFAFYPIALLFLVLYIILIRKRKIFLKDIFFALTLFLGMQSFHLLPEIMNLFDSDSISNSIVFKESVSGGANFFEALRGEGKISISLLLPPPLPVFNWVSFIAPIVVILGYLLQRGKSKEILLTSLFFVGTLFLASANITNIGLELYRMFFYIPGFSMFRHFFVQWAFVFIFFYALLFGQSLFVIFSRLKDAYIKLTAATILIVVAIGFWSFLNGSLVDGIQWGSNGVRTAMIMDPRYEQTLSFIRKLPDEGKILILPLSDNFNQVVHGANNAAYVGPSSISFLTSKKSFAGYQNFDSYPYAISEDILRFSREKKYEKLAQIFSLFNIRYVFHNTDPKVYEEKFPQFPNSYMMTSFPKTQEEYKGFVKEFPVRALYKNGPFNIFELDEKAYRPEVYIPDSIYRDEMMHVVGNQKVSYKSAFIDKEICKGNQIVSNFCKSIYNPPKIDIKLKKINPTEYKLHITQPESKSSFLLVFQNGYAKDWKLSLDKYNPFSEDKHIIANKYANAWIITKDDIGGKTSYTLNLYLETQKYFRYGITVTAVSLLAFFVFVLTTFIKRKK